MAFKNSWLKQATLYKFRYLIGYGFIIVLLLFIILADIGNIPYGLSEPEMQQAVTSTSLSLSYDMSWTINGVYNYLQKTSVDIFGLSRVSLIVPSLIFGIATVILFALTMRHWFKDSVAVVATTITMSSVLFISLLRNATPDIMLPFWTILLIFATAKLLAKREDDLRWRLVVVFAIAGLLYTPLGIYPLVAVIGSSLFHPHVRSHLKRTKRSKIVTLTSAVAVLLTPLLILLINHPDQLAHLSGLTLVDGQMPSLRHNLGVIYDIYLNVTKSGFSTTQVVPVFNIATIMLALLGFIKCVQDRYTARSYMLFTWIGITILTTLLAPMIVALTFLPMALLVAIGIDTLITDWYRLFPKNPYARIAGLIPLTILFIGISSGNISHYFNAHRHIANPFFSQSLPAIQNILTIEGNHAVTLITAKQDVEFYSILKQRHNHLTVTAQTPKQHKTPTIVLSNAQNDFSTPPYRIITSDRTDNPVLLRIYRPQ